MILYIQYSGEKKISSVVSLSRVNSSAKLEKKISSEEMEEKLIFKFDSTMEISRQKEIFYEMVIKHVQLQFYFRKS